MYVEYFAVQVLVYLYEHAQAPNNMLSRRCQMTALYVKQCCTGTKQDVTFIYVVQLVLFQFYFDFQYPETALHQVGTPNE